MTLITCPGCRKQISDTSLFCPNCGYNRQAVRKTSGRARSGNSCGIGCLFIIAIIVLLSFGNGHKNAGEKERECQQE